MFNDIWKVARFLLLPILFYGCGGTTIRYLNPTANFSHIKKVAVAPFSNFSDDRYAGEKVINALTIELLSRYAFDVIEHGEVSKALSFIKEGGFEDDNEITSWVEYYTQAGELVHRSAHIFLKKGLFCDPIEGSF